MQTLTTDTHQTNALTPTRPPVYVPEAKEMLFERVPSVTQYLVDHLISPKIGGLRFLASLLRDAQVKQMTLWKTTGESRDVAAISVQSIETLANSPDWPWGFQTTHKVIRLLEAFGLIQRVRHRHFVEIHFYLGEPELSLPKMLMNLDKLIASQNDKVRQAAERAKERLTQGNLFSKQPAQTPSTRLAMVTQILVGLQRLRGITIEADLTSVLSEASQCIAHVLNPAEYPCPAAGGEFLGKVGNLLPEFQMEFQTFSPPQGNLSTRQGNLLCAAGALTEQEDEDEGNPEAQRFPSEIHQDAAGASQGNPEAQISPKFPWKAQNSPLRVQSGNFGESLTLNVIPSLSKDSFSKNEKNDNVSEAHIPPSDTPGYAVAQDLAEVMEGTAENVRVYLKYLSTTDLRIVRAVFIYTQLKIRDGLAGKGKAIETPGKYFDTMVKAWGALKTYEAACACYEQDLLRSRGNSRARLQGIPQEVQAFVRRFEDWSYRDIAAELHTPATPSSLWTTPSALEDPEGDPRLKGQIPRVPTRWMETEREALELITHMQHDLQALPEYQVTIDRQPITYRPRGTTRSVWLVSAVVERIPEVYASPEQWEEQRAEAALAIDFERKQAAALWGGASQPGGSRGNSCR